jgi:hypothetical protein
MENEVVKATLGEALAEVTTALKGAVKEYGPDAVELALFAYRVDAVQFLLLGLIGVVAIVAALMGYAKWWRTVGKWAGPVDHGGDRHFDSEDAMWSRVFGCIPLLIVTIPAFFEGVLRFISAPHWVAAFGHPELLIATNALKAAGLL